MRWAAALGLLSGLVAGCADKPPPPSAPAVPNATINGVYRGTSTRYRADSRACPSPGLVLLSVLDRRFSYRWRRDTYIDSTIAPDNTLNGTLGDITLTGRLDGRRLEGDVQNGDCAIHFTATKR